MKSVDPVPFDANRLFGFSAAHLGNIVKLLSLPSNLSESQSKHSDLQTETEKEPKSKETEKLEQDALMKKLDEDIARVIEQELEEGREDHNADKRKAPLVSLDGLDLEEESVSSSFSSPREEGPEVEQETAPLIDKLPAVSLQGNLEPVKQTQLPGMSMAFPEVVEPIKQTSPQSPHIPESSPEPPDMSESFSSVESDLFENKEFQSSYIQVTALKALNNIIWTNKFSEMLLVPKSDLGADSNKALIDGTVVRRNEDMKVVLRLLMKKMVRLALHSSLFHRVFTLAELERAHSVLHKSMIVSAAEEEMCIADLNGEL